MLVTLIIFIIFSFVPTNESPTVAQVIDFVIFLRFPWKHYAFCKTWWCIRHTESFWSSVGFTYRLWELRSILISESVAKSSRSGMDSPTISWKTVTFLSNPPSCHELLYCCWVSYLTNLGEVCVCVLPSLLESNGKCMNSPGTQPLLLQFLFGHMNKPAMNPQQ